jgi:hypothetical protein
MRWPRWKTSASAIWEPIDSAARTFRLEKHEKRATDSVDLDELGAEFQRVGGEEPGQSSPCRNFRGTVYFWFLIPKGRGGLLTPAWHHAWHAWASALFSGMMTTDWRGGKCSLIRPQRWIGVGESIRFVGKAAKRAVLFLRKTWQDGVDCTRS